MSLCAQLEAIHILRTFEIFLIHFFGFKIVDRQISCKPVKCLNPVSDELCRYLLHDWFFFYQLPLSPFTLSTGIKGKNQEKCPFWHPWVFKAGPIESGMQCYLREFCTCWASWKGVLLRELSFYSVFLWTPWSWKGCPKTRYIFIAKKSRVSWFNHHAYSWMNSIVVLVAVSGIIALVVWKTLI